MKKPLFFLMCLAPVASAFAQLPPFEPPTKPGMFRVNATTGTPMPLESIGPQRDGKWGNTYKCYLPGASTVAFLSGEPQVFAGLRFGTTTLEDERKHADKLERLAVKDGKRYATGSFVPLDVTSHGEAVFGLDPDKKKNRGAMTFLFTPRQPLPPGEYAFSFSGLLVPDVGCSVSYYAAAFRISESAVQKP